MITAADFAYWKNFDLTEVKDADVSAAILTVNAQWTGALSFWAALSAEIRAAKRLALENLLVAWHLANFFPGAVRGVMASGGMPVSSKSIGGTSLSFDLAQVQDSLKVLNSNTFGIQALQMILSAPERFGIYG
jgi:hypothetical protein